MKAKYFIISNVFIVVVSFITSFILTLLISKNILQHNVGIILTRIVSSIIFLLSTMYLGRKIKNKGIILGIISIIIYLTFVLCLSITKIEISTIDVVIRSICLLAGAIIGVNTAKN